MTDTAGTVKLFSGYVVIETLTSKSAPSLAFVCSGVANVADVNTIMSGLSQSD